jgi:probable HAF family extracellular repeat protein
MKSRKLTGIMAMIVFVELAIPLQLAAQHSRYTITDVGTLGGKFGFARGMNSKGWVTGLSGIPGDTAYHAFLWRNGQILDLGTLGGRSALRTGLTKAAQFQVM